MPTKAIPIKDICITGGTQQRPVDDDVMKRYAEGFKTDIWKYEYFCDIAKGQVIFELYIEETEEAKDAS
ncbi:hypothetical protein LCGC14_2384760 [marine sediment metagenome]|uniref:Uncharacterized protein n=1 Tax=marine sediment metagenome TaxID=412755 RepID=A0A0F9EUI8_9ZZZZ